MLALDAATLRIGRAVLVEGLTLAVRPGEVLAIVGPNGAGKSTALRLLAGEVRPSAGLACLDGRPLADWSVEVLARRRAVLPQTSALAFGFQALDVVLLGRTPWRAGHAADLAAAARAMARAGVAHLAARAFPTLSGGEAQRVHLARALAQLDAPPGTPDAPRYLLLDEPTSALDLAHQHAVLRVARAEAARGTGVLAVLHDLNLAAEHADRVAVLAGGRLVAEGAPAAVLTPDVIGAAFGLTVRVVRNPCAGCPLVVADASASAFHPVPAGDAASLASPILR
ncbi:MAG: heme ABC transporter ATP-binding protein [Rubricoccaceae bacterium]